MSSTNRDALYENAINSIVCGIQDFETGESIRVISAVRNIYAGIILLGKYCLLLAAPTEDADLILAQKYVIRFDPLTKKIGFKPAKGKTIDFNDLIDRFKEFNLEWDSKINVLQKLRNSLEHKYSEDTDDVMMETIASCFPAIVHFFKILELDPKNELEDVWVTMVKQNDLYKQLQAQCLDSFKGISWYAEDMLEIECPECSSQLLYQVDATNKYPEEMEIKCRLCDGEFPAADFVESYVAANFDDTRNVQDGGVPQVYNCTFCHHETMVLDEKCYCYYCEETLGECIGNCGDGYLTPDTVSFENNSMCAYCADRMNKND